MIAPRLCLAGAMLAGVAAAAAAMPAAHGEVRLRGIYRSSFEVSTFAGCWLVFDSVASRQWQAQVARLEPVGALPQGWGRFALELSGIRQEGGRHGHRGAHRCLIRATRVHAVRRIGSAASH